MPTYNLFLSVLCAANLSLSLHAFSSFLYYTYIYIYFFTPTRPIPDRSKPWFPAGLPYFRRHCTYSRCCVYARIFAFLSFTSVIFKSCFSKHPTIVGGVGTLASAAAGQIGWCFSVWNCFTLVFHCKIFTRRQRQTRQYCFLRRNIFLCVATYFDFFFIYSYTSFYILTLAHITLESNWYFVPGE